MPYRIGPLVFATKKEITRHVQTLFDKYPTVGEPVTEEADHDFLLDLLQRHEECDQKVGSGVSHFSRDTHPIWKSPGFKLHRTDGSATDFSTSHCINARGPTIEARFREACKHAVDDILSDQKLRMFDAGNGTVPCPVTGVRLNRDQCRLEQTAPTWKVLVAEFLESIQHVASEADVTVSRDNQYWHELVNPDMARRFREYYRSRINLTPRRVTYIR